MDYTVDEISELAVHAAREAGAFIRSVRAEGVTVELKGELQNNLVTQADIGAEKIILEHISSRFPTHRVLSEEFHSELAERGHWDGPLWIIDPVDGTTNFAYGHYQVGVSIAFADGGKVLAGVVYAPFLDELFHATRGGGATLNGVPLRCSDARTLARSLITTGFPYERDTLPLLTRRVDAVLSACRDLRRLGAASLDLCWVAAGRVDGYYETVCPWDMAAGGLIAREAGAAVKLLRGSPDGSPEELCGQELVAAAPGIIESLCALLLDAAKE